MSTSKVRVPKGWRRLRVGEVRKMSDKYLYWLKDRWCPMSYIYETDAELGKLHDMHMPHIRRQRIGNSYSWCDHYVLVFGTASCPPALVQGYAPEPRPPFPHAIFNGNQVQLKVGSGET